jgi:hypothetical protein
MKNLMLIIACIAMSGLIVSCSKDGIDGAPGIPGVQGANGVDGNANVFASDSIVIQTWGTISTYKYQDIYIPEITQNIVESGTVYVYILNNPGEWIQLNWVFGTLSRSYSFSLQNVRVRFQNTDNTTTADPGKQVFRVVVIPSSNNVKDVDYSNYEKVKLIYNL